MWVDPRYRRQGIGDALIRRVVNWARGMGYGELFLWVVDGNGSAERLYERNGFRATGAVQEVRPGELEHEMSRSLR